MFLPIRRRKYSYNRWRPLIRYTHSGILLNTERSINDTLSFSQFLIFNTFFNRTINDTLIFTQDIISIRNIVQSLSLTHSFTKNVIVNRTLNDLLLLTQTLRLTTNLNISFETLNQQITIPPITQLTIYPYNYSPPINYGKTNYSLMVSDNFSLSAIFDLEFQLTSSQRRQLQEYFFYYRHNPFSITINNELWTGYLTHNNKELFQSQFKDELSTITLQFEAMP